METIIQLLIVCLVSGAQCFAGEAVVTEYEPWRGPGINCVEPCDMTAFMVPVEYGVTAACGPSWPFGTTVTFVTHWGEIVTRTCTDRGGGVGDYHVDVAAPEGDTGRYYSGRYTPWPVLWVVPLEDGELAREVSIKDLRALLRREEMNYEPNDVLEYSGDGQSDVAGSTSSYDSGEHPQLPGARGQSLYPAWH